MRAAAGPDAESGCGLLGCKADEAGDVKGHKWTSGDGLRCEAGLGRPSGERPRLKDQGRLPDFWRLGFKEKPARKGRGIRKK
jgi:hypothetical protein